MPETFHRVSLSIIIKRVITRRYLISGLDTAS